MGLYYIGNSLGCSFCALFTLGGMVMTLKDFFDNPEELFIGACLQFPLYFIIGWWILLLMPICGLLWRWGGVSGGIKLARWALVPIAVCGSAIACGVSWWILIASPFMIKLSPVSYGENSWLFKWLKNDFLTRLICFLWYWFSFSLVYLIALQVR